MKKILFALLTILLPLAAQAQEMTVTVDSVGRLASQLPDSIRYSIS